MRSSGKANYISLTQFTMRASSLLLLLFSAIMASCTAMSITTRQTIAEEDLERFDDFITLETEDTFSSLDAVDGEITLSIYHAEDNSIKAEATFKDSGLGGAFMAQLQAVIDALIASQGGQDIPEADNAGIDDNTSTRKVQERDAGICRPPKRSLENPLEIRASRCAQFCSTGPRSCTLGVCRRCMTLASIYCNYQKVCVV